MTVNKHRASFPALSVAVHVTGWSPIRNSLPLWGWQATAGGKPELSLATGSAHVARVTATPSDKSWLNEDGHFAKTGFSMSRRSKICRKNWLTFYNFFFEYTTYETYHYDIMIPRQLAINYRGQFSEAAEQKILLCKLHRIEKS